MQSAPTRDGALMAKPMTGGEALAQQLVREGVRHVFGVPGVQLDYAVDGLAKVSDRITYWNTRHEQTTAYMADGYARTTGDIGVCMVVPGPGLLNALAGVATAYACSSRVLCIAGQIPSSAIGRGFGLLHEIPEQSRILGALTKWSGQAGSPAEVPGMSQHIERALVIAAGPGLTVKARDGLDIVIEDFDRCADHGFDRRIRSFKVRHQHFDASRRSKLLDCRGGCGEMRRAAVAQVVAVD